MELFQSKVQLKHYAEKSLECTIFNTIAKQALNYYSNIYKLRL